MQGTASNTTTAVTQFASFTKSWVARRRNGDFRYGWARRGRTDDVRTVTRTTPNPHTPLSSLLTPHGAEAGSQRKRRGSSLGMPSGRPGTTRSSTRSPQPRSAAIRTRQRERDLNRATARVRAKEGGVLTGPPWPPVVPVGLLPWVPCRGPPGPPCSFPLGVFPSPSPVPSWAGSLPLPSGLLLSHSHSPCSIV